MYAMVVVAFQALFHFLVENSDKFIKIAFVASLLASFLLLFNLIGDFIHMAYGEITGAVSDIANISLPSVMGCIMSNLGIDQFLTSAFAIFFSASVFWASSVLLIFSYRGAIKILKIKSLRN